MCPRTRSIASIVTACLVLGFMAVTTSCTQQQAAQTEQALTTAQATFQALQQDPIFANNQNAQTAFTSILAGIRLGQLIVPATVMPVTAPSTTVAAKSLPVNLKAHPSEADALAAQWLMEAARLRGS